MVEDHTSRESEGERKLVTEIRKKKLNFEAQWKLTDNQLAYTDN